LTGHSSFLKSGPSQPASPPLVPAPLEATPVAAGASPSSGLGASSSASRTTASDSPAPAPTQADADRLGEKYQTQLTALAKEGVAKFHFLEYAPPAFVVFHQQLALQMTLKNPLEFAPAKSSIYKRAAQSFDLFLAPQLKDLTERISADVEFQLFDFSVLNKLSPGPKGTSEAVEFICPRAALKKFVDAEITNQQLLDQSFILVNGVRIALNLQLVE